MNAAQLINQDSGKVEYYTQPEIIEAARATMGGIDLDPFSSPVANMTVKAPVYFTTAEHHLYSMLWPAGESFIDGLSRDWHGCVWMNHPFSREMNGRCIEKVIGEFRKGRIRAACCITFAATSEAWFRPLLDYPQCFLFPRTNYLDADGNKVRGVTKGSVVTYLGYELDKFRRAFGKLGRVKV